MIINPLNARMHLLSGGSKQQTQLLATAQVPKMYSESYAIRTFKGTAQAILATGQVCDVDTLLFSAGQTIEQIIERKNKLVWAAEVLGLHDRPGRWRFVFVRSANTISRVQTSIQITASKPTAINFRPKTAYLLMGEPETHLVRLPEGQECQVCLALTDPSLTPLYVKKRGKTINQTR